VGGVEEKGYDYVEVMACPGGCVNGGGQLRPIARSSQQKEDEEGYVRNWEESGVQMLAATDETGGGMAPSQGPQWGNKEWTKEVEKAYWHDLPTPPPSPKQSSNEIESALELADRLALRVKVDVCRPRNVDQGSWGVEMDSDAEQRCRELFRTQYRAVESEVIGLAVKW